MSAILGWFLVLFSALPAFLMAVEIWINYPDNHGAAPICYLWSYIVIGVISAIARILGHRLASIALLVSIIGVLTTWGVDRWNIMVDYEIWLERGMPDWGHLAQKENR